MLGALVIVLAGLLAYPIGSLEAALTAPGAAPWTVRSVDWFRDHGGSPIVNAAENWYYSNVHPAETPPKPSDLPRPQQHGGGGVSVSVRGGSGAPAALPVPAGLRPLSAEGQWQPWRRTADGAVAMWTTVFRPDRRYAGMVAAVAEFPRGRTIAHLVAGTQQPAGHWPGHAAVPAGQVPSLVATFNAGWRFNDSPGGFSIGHRVGPPLRNGFATAAITRSGQLKILSWNRAGNHTDIVAARQNLHLIVDRGAEVPGLTNNKAGLWGSAHNQLQFTSRTGLGVDRAGNVIFIAGTHMNLRDLASAFVKAHAVTAMELDIHASITFFAGWAPNAHGVNQPTKLLPTMKGKADRFTRPDQRDFFYLTVPSAGSAH